MIKFHCLLFFIATSIWVDLCWNYYKDCLKVNFSKSFCDLLCASQGVSTDMQACFTDIKCLEIGDGQLFFLHCTKYLSCRFLLGH